MGKMGNKITKDPLFHFYLSLTYDELAVVERYRKLLNVQFGTEAFNRNGAMAYAINHELAPKVERAESILAGKKPPLETRGGEVEVTTETEEPHVKSGGFNP